jgi:hypothetical protein
MNVQCTVAVDSVMATSTSSDFMAIEGWSSIALIVPPAPSTQVSLAMAVPPRQTSHSNSQNTGEQWARTETPERKGFIAILLATAD